MARRAKEAIKTPKAPRKKRNVPGFLKPFAAIGGYFAGSWRELREVRWPNRRSTWSLTFAVLAFTAFFVVVILLLDAGFQYLFQEVLLK